MPDSLESRHGLGLTGVGDHVALAFLSVSFLGRVCFTVTANEA